MIKANELRLGNWVLIKSSKIKLEGPKLAFIFDRDGLITRCDPIPLTPEILEKCGFIHKEDFLLFRDNEWFSIKIDGDWCSLYCDELYFAVDFKYLHQLQNLYFALTGNELEIKL